MSLFSIGKRNDPEHRKDRFLDHKLSKVVFCEAPANVANQ